MSVEVNLSAVRKGLNEGKSLILVYTGQKRLDGRHCCWLSERDDYKDLGDYGFVEDIITSDRKDLLNFMSISCDYALMLEMCPDGVRSSLVHRDFGDPNDLLTNYYNIPFISATHPRLKTSLYRLNEAIRELGISTELMGMVNAEKPESMFRKQFTFQLQDDKKTLTLVRRYGNDVVQLTGQK